MTCFKSSSTPGNIIIELLCAIATTAPDLLNPDGTTVAPLCENVADARIKRVKGFALVKSSIKVALQLEGNRQLPHHMLNRRFDK